MLWMGSAGLKRKIVEAVESLPEDATVEDAIERLYFLAKIERGLEQSEAGNTIPHEDIKKRFLR
jgi:predicted transcriptional regulator